MIKSHPHLGIERHFLMRVTLFYFFLYRQVDRMFQRFRMIIGSL